MQTTTGRDLTRAQAAYYLARGTYEVLSTEANAHSARIADGVDLDDEATVHTLVDQMLAFEARIGLPAARAALTAAEKVLLQTARVYMEATPEYRKIRQQIAALWTTGNYAVYHKLVNLTARLAV